MKTIRRLLAALAHNGPVYCSRCGASNPQGSTYCLGCGGMLNP